MLASMVIIFTYNVHLYILDYEMPQDEIDMM
jgi:hypothetical protein